MKTVVIRKRNKAFANRVHSVHGFGFTARRMKTRGASDASWIKWRDQANELNVFSAPLPGSAGSELVSSWWEN